MPVDEPAWPRGEKLDSSALPLRAQDGRRDARHGVGESFAVGATFYADTPLDRPQGRCELVIRALSRHTELTSAMRGHLSSAAASPWAREGLSRITS